MDAAWLKETVGPKLVKALAATVAAEPEDPVEYLANVLLKCASLHARLAAGCWERRPCQ